jgi:hypothetical protein
VGVIPLPLKASDYSAQHFYALLQPADLCPLLLLRSPHFGSGPKMATGFFDDNLELRPEPPDDVSHVCHQLRLSLL